MASSQMASPQNDLIPFEDSTDKKILLFGSRPWDANVQHFQENLPGHMAQSVFYMDRMPHDEQGEPKDTFPLNFYHVDANNDGPYSAHNEYYQSGPLSETLTSFTRAHQNQFDMIAIDWMTYHHIQRDEAWLDFNAMLKPKGYLVFPVTYKNFQDKNQNSFTKAFELSEKMTKILPNTTLDSADSVLDSTILGNVTTSFYKRDDGQQGFIYQHMNSMEPWFVISQKQ